MRYVDYNKCKGCLKCVDVCEHGAIEVISLKEGKLSSFEIDEKKCSLCKKCLSSDFCFRNLYKLEKDENSDKFLIVFNETSLKPCLSCLKCFKECPNNAIIPIIK